MKGAAVATIVGGRVVLKQPRHAPGLNKKQKTVTTK
jgi:hypothetical protein